MEVDALAEGIAKQVRRDEIVDVGHHPFLSTRFSAHYPLGNYTSGQVRHLSATSGSTTVIMNAEAHINRVSQSPYQHVPATP